MRGGPASPLGASWICAASGALVWRCRGQVQWPMRAWRELTGSVRCGLIFAAEAIETDVIADHIVVAVDSEVVVSNRTL